MGIRKSVVGLLPGKTQSVDEPPAAAAAEPAEEGKGDTDEADAAGLFNCSSCGTTYISETMDACPDCETAVDSIPTEADLGMV